MAVHDMACSPVAARDGRTQRFAESRLQAASDRATDRQAGDSPACASQRAATGWPLPRQMICHLDPHQVAVGRAPPLMLLAAARVPVPVPGQPSRALTFNGVRVEPCGRRNFFVL
jgi:hypothetical protein